MTVNYDKAKTLEMLDAVTISALVRVYGLKYDNIAIRMKCTRQNICYKQRTNSYTVYEKEIVWELLQQHGLDSTFLILINTMIKTQQRKVSK
ncbi:hypothetical protein RJD24_14650 [Bacillaceae bacterium IKA-2]|nr:hypothetical protein RJD24_14650 [Bacillaceae bacterium IKA-2]